MSGPRTVAESSVGGWPIPVCLTVDLLGDSLGSALRWTTDGRRKSSA